MHAPIAHMSLIHIEAGRYYESFDDTMGKSLISFIPLLGVVLIHLDRKTGAFNPLNTGANPV
jgi:hypothetical protein